jgi:dynein heavy chain
LIRQHLDHGYWYDLKDTSKVVLQDTQFIGAMGPPGGGRNPVSPRFLRHFIVISVTPFSDDTMTRIFGALITNYLKVRCLAAFPQLVRISFTDNHVLQTSVDL